MANGCSFKNNFNTRVMTPKLNEWFESNNSLCWSLIAAVKHLPTIDEVLGLMPTLQNQREKSRVVSTARWKLLSFEEIKWTTIAKDASIRSFAVFNFCWSIRQYVRSTFPLFGSLRQDGCREFKHSKSYVVSCRTAYGRVQVRSCLRKQKKERGGKGVRER